MTVAKVTTRCGLSAKSQAIPGAKSPLENVLAQIPGGAISQMDMEKLKAMFSEQPPERLVTTKTTSQVFESEDGLKAASHNNGQSADIQQN